MDRIRKNPKITHRELQKKTKVKIERVFKGGLRTAYQVAGVPLSKSLSKRTREEQIRDVLEFIKSNPKCTVTEIQDNVNVTIPRLFGSVITAYKMAGVKYEESENIRGSSIPEIKNRAARFEKYVIDFLSKYGKMQSKVRIGRKIADGLLEYKGQIIIIEVKDYRGRNNVCFSDVKQVLSYIKGFDCKKGIILHHYNKGEIREYHVEGCQIYALPFQVLKGEISNNEKMKLVIKNYKKA